MGFSVYHVQVYARHAPIAIISQPVLPVLLLHSSTASTAQVIVQSTQLQLDKPAILVTAQHFRTVSAVPGSNASNARHYIRWTAHTLALNSYQAQR